VNIMGNSTEKASIPLAHLATDAQGVWREPQPLTEHLKNVSDLASEFAAEFGAGTIASSLGLVHDLGKWNPAWQSYLRKKTGFPDGSSANQKVARVEHSIHGAKFLSISPGGAVGKAMAFAVAGHHGGLPDWYGSEKPASTLHDRLEASDISVLPDSAIEFAKSATASAATEKKYFSKGLGLSLWIRMLFSCLVDADRLDAESYESPGKAANRSQYEKLSVLSARFDEYMAKKRAGSSSSPVNQIRNSIFTDCLNAAELPRGVFSLSVPTGGGKTLSSLGFALKHAILNHQRRIIYVIPYTSIIEQNAQVFKEALGESQVVEHHSNVVDEERTGHRSRCNSVKADDEFSDDDVATTQARRQLAIENWDAPMIVTTSVQFFESLFSDSPSRCRKLHNIANSVVILDEAQLVPTEFLNPILETLGLLVKQYGVTLLICTATQPAFANRPGFRGLGDVSVSEIVNDVPGLFCKLKRVEYEMPARGSSPVAWRDLANELAAQQQVLCVVSDRRACRELHSLMPIDTYHLSALMCPEHRTMVIGQIKEKLALGEPVRVVSTQLVEAGVDLDFPVVFRAMAGLDSIVQAGGRCNREGRLGKLGRVKVFVPERRPPVGILRKASEVTTEMLVDFGDEISSPAAFSRFFEHLYWRANSLDSKDICGLLRPDSDGLRFRSAAFQMIRNGDIAIAVPYGNGLKILEDIRRKGFPDYRDLRRLQRYVVTIPPAEFDVLRQRDSLDEVAEGLWALVSQKEYSDVTGLLVREIESDVGMFVMT